MPEELRNGIQEADAFLTQAKKQRSEIEKARGFFKKAAYSDPKDKAERLKKLKARLPCAKCGALGHWKDDPECPMNKGHKKTKTSGSYYTYVLEQELLGEGRVGPPRGFYAYFLGPTICRDGRVTRLHGQGVRHHFTQRRIFSSP